MNAEENIPKKDITGKSYTKYEALQRQRYLERKMRAERQKIHLLKEGGADEEDIIIARARYRATSTEYTRFSKAMNLPQERDRVTIDGLGNIGVGKYKLPNNIHKPTVKNSTSGGVANSSNSGIMKVSSNAHQRNLELEKIISKCINQEKPVFAEDLAHNFSKIKPEKNKYIISMHGCPKSVFLYGHEIDEITLANIIRSRKDYNNEEIILISCNTGNSDNVKVCFAQKLANELGVKVHAPTHYGAISYNGVYYSSDITGRIKLGKFAIFEPTKEG